MDLLERLPTLPSGLEPRDPNKTRAWTVEVNDEIVPRVRTLVIHCEREPGKSKTALGRIEYGAEPDKNGYAGAYDTWIFYEKGGAVTLPFCVRDGQLWVALSEQKRFCEKDEVWNRTGVVPNAPRGFHDVRMVAAETAAREMKGEVGVFDGDTSRPEGENGNANNAWLKYEDERNADGKPVRQGGVTAYAVEVNPASLEPNPDKPGTLRIKPNLLGERPVGSPYEMIGKTWFVPWQTAARNRCMMTSFALLRLIDFLVEQKRLEFRVKTKKELEAKEQAALPNPASLTAEQKLVADALYTAKVLADQPPAACEARKAEVAEVVATLRANQPKLTELGLEVYGPAIQRLLADLAP
ncbi:MAG: hypothetical protein WCV84_05190 [Patescibacteria group bacterium]